MRRIARLTARRVVASRLNGSDPRILAWDDAVLGIVSTMSAPDEFLTGKLFSSILDATVLIVFLPVLLLYSVKLTFIVLGFCGLIALVIWGLIRPFRERLTALYQAEAQRQALLVETMHGMATVKSLALEPIAREDMQPVHIHAVVGMLVGDDDRGELLGLDVLLQVPERPVATVHPDVGVPGLDEVAAARAARTRPPIVLHHAIVQTSTWLCSIVVRKIVCYQPDRRAKASNKTSPNHD